MQFQKTPWLLAALFLLSFSFVKHKPVLYIIGDSTVKNGDGKNGNELQGWGSFIGAYFDTNKIDVQNHAIGGRSSRTFITDGRWDNILSKLQKGDFVIMQFGHNDNSPLDDTARARGTLKGIGDDSVEVYNPIRKQKEVVHSYGWYMRKYVEDTKAKGAIAIICSPVPRNNWKAGKVLLGESSYAIWAKLVAEKTKSNFLDLNNLLANAYQEAGEEKITTFFPKDHTHTNKEGAVFNADMVIREIKNLKKIKLKKYLL